MCAEQTKRSAPRSEQGPSHKPQSTSPENKDFGRRALLSRLFEWCSRTAAVTLINFSAISPCFAFTRFQNSSSTMRSFGTLVTIHSDSGLRREMRFPVEGFLT
jgi:hypothetical protein